MKKLISMLLITGVMFLIGYGNKNEKYLEGLGFNVVSYEGEQIVNQDDDDKLFKSIVAVQYDELNDETLTLHNYTVKNNDSIQASLLILDGEIIGGYKVCDKGYIYSLDGGLADVSGLYNN